MNMAAAVAFAPEMGAEMDTVAFKNGMRRLAQPVAIATTMEAGVRAGLVISSFSSLSVDPPRITASIARTAGAYPLLRRSGVIAVNVLGAGHEALVRCFSSTTVKGEDRFALGHWRQGRTGAPVLDDAVSSFDCTISELIDAGSHVIVIADVVDVEGDAQRAPLLYREGGLTLAAPSVQGRA